jgi:hypothetical protein
VFVLGESIQPSLLLVGKAGAYPSEAHFRYHALAYAPVLTNKHYTRLERFARDRHSSLLQILVNYYHKKFFNNVPAKRQPKWSSIAERGLTLLGWLRTS